MLRFTRVTIAGQSRGKRRGVGVVKKTTQHDVFCILLAALCWTAPHQLSYSRQQSNIAKTARRRREWRQYVTALNHRPTSTMAVDLFFLLPLRPYQMTAARRYILATPSPLDWFMQTHFSFPFPASTVATKKRKSPYCFSFIPGRKHQ